MTDIQAALGCSQLSRIGEFLQRRRELAERYERLLEDMPLRRPRFSAADGCAWHLYVVQLPPQRRRAVYDALRGADIGVNVHYIPVHLQPYYRRLGFRRGDFPASEAYYDGALTLPLHPRLTDEQQDRVVAILRRALEIP
jgi:dTDP-4-amino-4,6-dideoxygalactose transaminase